MAAVYINLYLLLFLPLLQVVLSTKNSNTSSLRPFRGMTVVNHTDALNINFLQADNDKALEATKTALQKVVLSASKHWNRLIKDSKFKEKVDKWGNDLLRNIISKGLMPKNPEGPVMRAQLDDVDAAVEEQHSEQDDADSKSRSDDEPVVEDFKAQNDDAAVKNIDKILPQKYVAPSMDAPVKNNDKLSRTEIRVATPDYNDKLSSLEYDDAEQQKGKGFKPLNHIICMPFSPGKMVGVVENFEDYDRDLMNYAKMSREERYKRYQVVINSIDNIHLQTDSREEDTKNLKEDKSEPVVLSI